MIRFLLKEALSNKSFQEGRRIEWREVADATGIHRVTLSKIVNHRGYNATIGNLDKLCRYFECNVGDLATYVADEELYGAIKKSAMGPKANTEAAQAGTRARYAKVSASKLASEAIAKKPPVKRPTPSAK
jgi:putative transcriptional regulator